MLARTERRSTSRCAMMMRSRLVIRTTMLFLSGSTVFGLSSRLVDVQTHFFNKRGGHNEENQHDENDVQHGRQIDLLVTFLFTAAAEWSTHNYPCAILPLILRALVYSRPAV